MTGAEAEELISKILKSEKHKIIELNWKTQTCEIDIVSKYKKAIYFTEVKYRTNLNQGNGFDYITKKKLKQMQISAELWCTLNSFDGSRYIQAASVSSYGEVVDIRLIY